MTSPDTSAVATEPDEDGRVLVAPYEKIIYRGEGGDEEYQLVPTAQIATYLRAIELLKERDNGR